METIENDNPQKPLSIAEFINENHKHISVIGIFTAVTLFATNIKILYFATALSFLFLTLTLFLWVELIGKFPSKGSGMLGWFEAILAVSILVIVGYWFVEYRNVWSLILPYVFQLIIVGIVSAIIKKTDFFNKLFNAKPGGKKLLRYLLYFAIILISAYLGIILGNLITKPTVSFLESLLQIK